MIICPLQLEECSKTILPRPKSVFVMAPDDEKKSQRCKKVLANISKALDNCGFKVSEGSKLANYGDYFCSICQSIQSCAFGVAIVGEEMASATQGNIYVEVGLMQGFGKPVVICIDKKKNLPTDFVRNFCIFYRRSGYVTKFKTLLNSIKSLKDYYSRQLGDLAFKVGDYEKAGRYYQEAYLIGEDAVTKRKLKKLINKMEKDKSVPYGYKKRLLENMKAYCREIELG